MEKKQYIAPSIEMCLIDSEGLMAGSIETGVSDSPATDGGRAKEHPLRFDDNTHPTESVWDWED